MIECNALVTPRDVCGEDRPEEQLFDELVIAFTDDHTNPDRPISRMYVEHVTPNAFPDGPIENYLGTGKVQGCNNGQLGAELTDRTFREGGDGFRHHDVMHLTLATMVSWSPIIRSLMNRRRRSDHGIDHIEDGPRAQELEENILNRFGMAIVDGETPHSAAQRLSVEAAHDVRHFLSKRGDRCVHILPEQWHKALMVGSVTMAFLNSSIGAITASDRDPAAPPEQKMHTAWVYFNRLAPAIKISMLGAEHAMQTSANWIDIATPPELRAV